jgi:hypothetical protein
MYYTNIQYSVNVLNSQILQFQGWKFILQE